MTIHRALSGDPFRVDALLCREAAINLSGYVSAHQIEAWSDLPPLSQFVFKTLFISICHSFNWDFLQSAMARWLLPSPEARLAELAEVRSTVISTLLADYSKPERIKAQKRALMLRETARQLQQLITDGSIERLLQERQLAGPTGFYAVMKSIPAFAEDPLEKKVRVLAHDLYRESIIRFADPENLKPAIEYHILRLYLRSGRVYPIKSEILEALRVPTLNPRARLVKLLRTRVEEAMSLTAYYSGLDIATLNYLEWQIGRSICLPQPPALCLTPPVADIPADVAAVCLTACAMSTFCRALHQESYPWFHEPQFEKAIY